MKHPLRRFASPLSRGATPVARQSRFHGVCRACSPARPTSFSPEN
jgi:hypothetical protein